MNTRGKKYWKGLLYSSTIIAMLGTPVSSLAAIIQNNQTEELTKEQEALLNYQDAIAAYKEAEKEYKDAKKLYEDNVARYNELSQAAITAKTEAETKAQELETAKQNYEPIRQEYETVEQEFTALKDAFDEAEPDYLLKKGAYETAKKAYDDLSGPYESALSDFNLKRDEYNNAMDAYEALQEEIRGTDGTGGLVGALKAAQAAYDTALTEYTEARKLFNDSKSAYEKSVNEYKAVFSQYEDKQVIYKELLAEYVEVKATYTENKTAYEAHLTELERLKGLLTEANTKYENEKANYLPIQQEYEDVISANQGIIDDYNQKKSDYEERITALNGELTTYNNDLAAYDLLREEYQTTKNAYDEIVTEYQNTTNSLTTAKTQYDAANKRYEDAQKIYNGDLTAYNELKADYEQKLSDFNEILDPYIDQLNLYKRNYEAAKKILDSYDAGTTEYATAKAAYDDNKQKYDAIYPEYLVVKLEADKVNEEFSKVKKDFQDKTSSYNAIQNEYTRLKAQYDSLVSQKTAQEESYKKIESQYDSATKQYDAVKGQHEALETRVAAINQEVSDIQAAKITLDQEYETAYTAIEAIKDKYEPADAAFQVAEQAYVDAYAAFNTANNYALSLVSIKNDLEDELTALKSKYTDVYTELTSLDGQKNQLLTDQGNLATALAEAGRLRDEADTKLGTANSTLADTKTVLGELEAKLIAADNELNKVLIPELGDLEEIYADLKDRYDDQVYPDYIAAKGLFDDLEPIHTDLAGKVEAMKSMLVDDSDFMTKYTAAKASYEALEQAHTDALNAYNKAQLEIDNFNNLDEIKIIKDLYNDANTKYGLMETALEAAQKAVDEYNLDTTNAPEYQAVLAAYNNAKDAPSQINTAFNELNGIIKEFPIQEETIINGRITGNEDTSGLLLGYDDWKAKYQTALSKAKTIFNESKQAIADYQTAYETYKQSGIASGLPDDVVINPNFIATAESVFNDLEIDQNIKNVEAYSEMVKLMKNLVIDYQEAMDILENGNANTDSSEPPITTQTNVPLWKAFAEGVNINNIDFSYLDDEFKTENITNQEIWDKLLQTYQEQSMQMVRELDIWSPFIIEKNNEWGEKKQKFRDDLTAAVDGTDLTWATLVSPLVNGGIVDAAERYKGLFEDSVSKTHEDLKQIVENNLNMYVMVSNLNSTDEVWDIVASGGGITLRNLLNGFVSHQPQMMFNLETPPFLNVESSKPLLPIEHQIPTVQILEPEKPDQITFEVEPLGPVSITEVSYDVDAPTMTKEDYKLPEMPTFEQNLEGLTVPGTLSWDKRTPTEITEDLPEIIDHDGLDPLIPFTPDNPTDNETPVEETGTIGDIANPSEPVWDIEEPKSPDDLVKKAEDINPVIVNPTAPEDAVELIDEVEINFSVPKKPTINKPVLPVKAGYVESPRPLTPPKEPTNETPETPDTPSEDPENPGGGEGGREDVDGGNTGRNNGGGNTPTTSGNRVSGSQVTNTNLPNTNKGTLPKTNDVNNPWYQALGASIIGALGLSGLRRRKKTKADKK